MVELIEEAILAEMKEAIAEEVLNAEAGSPPVCVLASKGKRDFAGRVILARRDKEALVAAVRGLVQDAVELARQARRDLHVFAPESADESFIADDRGFFHVYFEAGSQPDTVQLSVKWES